MILNLDENQMLFKCYIKIYFCYLEIFKKNLSPEQNIFLQLPISYTLYRIVKRLKMAWLT
jgi:hypothetical protein